MKRLCLFVIPALLASGCNKLTDLDHQAAQKLQGAIGNAVGIGKVVPQSPQNSEESPSKGSSTSDPDQSLLLKLNGYIDCLNRGVPRAEDSYKRYLTWANKQTGPTCTETYISYGLYSLYEDSVQKCRDAAEKGKSMTPSLPEVESAAADFASCNADLVPLVKKADDYYDQQDYRDDHCAKAKEWHPQLIATFEKCFDAAKRLSHGVDLLKGDLDRRRLVKLEKDGPSFQAATLRLLLGANDLLKTFGSDGKVAKDAFTPKCLELEKNFQVMDDYASSHRDEISRVFWGSAFVSSAKSFVSEAKFIRRDLEDGKSPGDRLEHMVDDYNRLVNDSNNLRY